MARYAVIDVGTNSVKFHVGERDAEGKWTTVVDRAEVTRLGEGLAANGGEFSPEAMERTAAAVAGMAAEVARVCAALGVAPIAGLHAYTLDQLQAELTQVSRGVRVAQVHKRRQRYTIGGCTAEMTEVVADGRPIRTVAIELEDPARVVAAVREMGLDHFDNISYPRGLKRLLGLSG